MAFNMNPADFANRPHELIKDIARKGSESSHASGFAHTDESEQVIQSYLPHILKSNVIQCDAKKALQRDITSKDGHSSGGSFGPGDSHAREASHQSGQTSGGSFEPEDPRAQEAGKKGGSSGQHEE